MKADDDTAAERAARQPRARAAGKSSVTPDEVRQWADTVQPGECITFPNGLVVDKRPVWNTTSAWNWNGYQCQMCWQWVPLNSVHTCAGQARRY